MPVEEVICEHVPKEDHTLRTCPAHRAPYKPKSLKEHCFLKTYCKTEIAA
ncbi:MAG: hypothetical protein IJU56_08420 [Clostridia bacterium]|nr:hypothetical protein [Clostridia bacterium]